MRPGCGDLNSQWLSQGWTIHPLVVVMVVGTVTSMSDVLGSPAERRPRICLGSCAGEDGGEEAVVEGGWRKKGEDFGIKDEEGGEEENEGTEIPCFVSSPL
jgi:hypothetical protein